MRRWFALMLLTGAAACDKAANPAADTGARDIAATAAKAIADTEAAQREAARRPAAPLEADLTREQSPAGAG